MIQAASLRRWLAPLRHWPVHPQWLILRGQQCLIRQHLARLQGVVVLDIGCADAWLSRYLKSDCRYIGLDYPPSVAAGYQAKPTVFGDAASLPFADGSVDVVSLLEVMEHLPDPECCLGEVARVLKPNGVFLLSVPFLYPLHDEPRDFQRWTRYGLEHLLVNTGFQVEVRHAQGHPMETGAMLTAIALANSMLVTLRRGGLGILLLPFLGLLIPMANILGWSLAALLPASELMPMGYQLVARRDA